MFQNDTLKKILLTAATLGCLAIVWAGVELALTIRLVRPAALSAIAESQALIDEGKGSLERANKILDTTEQFAQKLMTVERLNTIDKYIKAQAVTTQIATNTARKVGTALERVLLEELTPAIFDFRVGFNRQFESTTGLTDELRAQIRENGEAARALLKDPNLAGSLEELRDLVGELRKRAGDPRVDRILEAAAGTSEKVELTAEDLRREVPETTALIKSILTHTDGTTGHIEKSAERIDKKLEEFTRPQSKKAKLLSILLQVAGVTVRNW